jgi:hypothetical protein
VLVAIVRRHHLGVREPALVEQAARRARERGEIAADPLRQRGDCLVVAQHRAERRHL